MNVFVFFMSCFIYDLSTAEWSAVGKSQTFNRIVPNNNFESLSWQNEQKYNQYYCNDSKCDPAVPELASLYHATITNNFSTFKSVFTIKAVTISQHNTSWYCQTTFKSGVGDGKQYYLYVYAAVETPSCGNLQLTNHDRSITLQCWTEKVYPDAMCTIYIITNGRISEISNASTVYKNEQSSTPGYYRTECNNTVSVDVIGRGLHQFYVIMSPNIPIDIADDIKNQSEKTSSILIDYPKAALRPDCEFKEYIRENETRNCTCYNNNTSFLPTQVRWSNNGGDDGNMNFIAKRPSFQYQCTVFNRLNWTDVVTYEGKVAYPPSIANLNLSNHERNRCENPSYIISGICSVGDSDPKPLVSINVNNSLVTSQLSSNTREYYFEIDTNSSGIFSISCQVKNEFFPMKSITKYTTLYGPPKLPKIGKLIGNDIHFGNENTLKVTAGESVIICESSGGYPNLKNLSLNCEINETHTEDSDIVSMILNVPIEKTPHIVICTCVVSHETKCHGNNSSIQVEIISKVIVVTDFKMVYIGIGIAIGLVICTVVVFLILSKMYLGQLKSSNDEFEELVNNTELYFIKDSSTDKGIYPEYTNVKTNMTSAAEVPKNCTMLGT